LIKAGVIEHQLTLTEAVEDGNLAYQRGLWAGAMLNEQGEKQTFGGNVHLVYRKQADGTWKAVTHIWN
jgi:ketosteroid isomerase-like protein